MSKSTLVTSDCKFNLFGDSFSNEINDKVTLEDISADFGVLFKNKTLGKVSFRLNYTDINYGYNSIFIRSSLLNE